MAFGFFKRLAGDPSSVALRRAQSHVSKINSYEEDYRKLSDEQLRGKTAELKERYGKGETLDDLLPEAFAVVREGADRSVGMRHFDVQLVGGAVLHNGQIAEMKTGEGKTLVATLPVYLNALAGEGVHVVTVNDYLARRDTEWMGQVYQFLGLTVGNIYHDQPHDEKKAAYEADITYGTNNEFGFDYLRDNMVSELEQMVQRKLNYAIVDEVDSILIDESRTPLIISAPSTQSGDLYKRFAGLVPNLKKEEDFTVDEKRRSAILTDEGIKKVEKYLGVNNVYEAGGVMMVHHLEQALQAQALFRRDKEYVVQDGEVIIVDEFTGRMMPGRRFSEGLHQAIEAKEGVKIQEESRTMATITFQNYFRLYQRLAGMTGTAATEREEFQKIYSLDVVTVPTHRDMIRKDNNDQIYKTEKAKLEAISRDVAERQKSGQPVLLGTIAVEKSERLSSHLKQAGVKHEILNAKNHAREAEIIANAGAPGSVTVSTNMAGRGTDIKLGGEPPVHDDAKSEAVYEKAHGAWQERHEQAKSAGGLHVIGSERHEARRIDNQLRGRSGRQGDPGSTQFFVSLEDDLMRIFAGDKIKRVMERLKVPDDQPIQAGIISKSIESAQKKVEGHNFDIRKHVVEYDDVMNAHREVIYGRRRNILEKADLKENIQDMLAQEVDLLIALHAAGDDQHEWNFGKIAEGINSIVNVEGDLAGQLKDTKSKDELRSGLVDMLNRAYQAKEEEQGEENMRTLERMVMLRTIDTLWVDHLDSMEHLRDGIGLRGYGQRDPLVEYKQEAYRMFENLLGGIQAEVTHTLFKVGLVAEPQPSEIEQAAKQVKTAKPGDTGRSKAAKVGTEEPGEEPIEEEKQPTTKKARRKAKQAETPAPPAPAPQATVTNAEALASTPSDAEVAAKAAEVKQEGSTTVTISQRSTATPNPASSATAAKVGRNDPCPCGSGLKYKRCGLINAPEHKG